MAGASVALGPRMALDVGYRYLNMGDAATVKDAFGDMTFHNLASHGSASACGGRSRIRFSRTSAHLLRQRTS